MKKLVGIIALFFAAIALPLSAADISGAWTGQIVFRANSQPHPIGLNLKADGNKLIGTFCMNNCGPAAPRLPIQGGKIEGDTISFSVTLGAPELPRMDLQGTVNADTMTLTVSGNPPECGSNCQIGEGSATRAK